MSKFKGYAQASGFKNIQLPDKSKRTREEGERTISRMQRNFEIERENTLAVMNALNDKYRIEEQNRQFVFDLETENRNNIRNRMAENAKVVNENNQQQIRQTQAKYEALASLSATAGKVTLEQLQERDKAGKQKGEQLANTIALAGGSYSDILYMRQIDKAHISNDEKFRSIVDRLRANGAPNDIVDQIRNANSSTLYGLNKTLLVEAGLNYPQELARFETQPLQLADGTDSPNITLGAARGMGDKYKELVEAQELRNTSEYMAQFQGQDNDPMVSRYLYPKMVEAERASARGHAAEKLQRGRREDELSLRETIRTNFNDANGHQTNINFIQNSTNKRTARFLVGEVYEEMAASGAWGDSRKANTIFDDLLDTKISIGGQPPKTFRELYGPEGTNDPWIADVRSAIYNYDKELKGKLAEQKKEANLVKEEQIFQQLHNNLTNGGEGNFSKAAMDEVLERMEREGIPTDRVKALLEDSTYSAVYARQTIAEARELQRQGQLTLDFFDGITNKEVLAEFSEFMAAQEAYRGQMPLTTEGVEKALEEHLKQQLKLETTITGAYIKDDAFKFAMADIMADYNRRVSVDISTTNAADVQVNAVNALKELISSKDEQSPYYIVPATEVSKDGKIPKSQAFLARYTAAADNTRYIHPTIGRDLDGVLEEMRDNPELPLKEAIISSDMAKELAQRIKSGQNVVLPPIMYQLADASNIPVHEIVDKQIKLNGIGDVTVQPDLVQEIKNSLLTPELNRIINKPTASNINTVVIASGNQVPFVRKGEDGFVDVQSLGRSLNFRSPDVMAAIWALETGNGESVIGRNALFNVKSLDGTGSSKTVTEYDASGNPYKTVETYTDYDSPAQAAQAFIDTVSKYPGVKESKTPREMVMAIAAGGYGTDPRYAEKLINVLVGKGVNVDGPFVSYEGPVTRDPNYSSPTLKHVYNVGSIGWGSTGPHLDLKQEDNPNTPENEKGAYYEYDDPEIAEFVFVDDLEKGMVPLPQVPMTGSWESHANRPIPSNGYDYGIHDGRGIHIKPPARVVNSFRTSQGDDMMIIELPSGRRFKFHHGRQVND